MNSTDHHARGVIGLNGSGPENSNGNGNGKPAEAVRPLSPDGQEQRVAELERQLADLSARNAGLVRANEVRTQAEKLLQEVLRSTRCILNSGEAEAPEDW